MIWKWTWQSSGLATGETVLRIKFSEPLWGDGDIRTSTFLHVEVWRLCNKLLEFYMMNSKNCWIGEDGTFENFCWSSEETPPHVQESHNLIIDNNDNWFDNDVFIIVSQCLGEPAFKQCDLDCSGRFAYQSLHRMISPAPYLSSQ